MSIDHWFIDALAEMVEEAKSDCSPNVLAGLSTTIETFCAEAGFNEEQIQAVRNLTATNTYKPRCTDRSTEASPPTVPQRLHS